MPPLNRRQLAHLLGGGVLGAGAHSAAAGVPSSTTVGSPNAERDQPGRSFGSDPLLRPFPSMAAARGAQIPAYHREAGLTLGGYYSPHDGGGAQYRFAPVQLEGPGRFQSADGAWWELAETWPNDRMFGVRRDGVSDDTAPSQQAWRYAANVSKFLFLTPGTARISGSLIDFNGAHDGISPFTITGPGRQCSLYSLTNDCTSDAIIKITGNVSSYGAPRISGLTLSGFGIEGNGHVANAFAISAVSYLSLEVSVDDVLGSALIARQVWDSSYDCHFTRCGDALRLRPVVDFNWLFPGNGLSGCNWSRGYLHVEGHRYVGVYCGANTEAMQLTLKCHGEPSAPLEYSHLVCEGVVNSEFQIGGVYSKAYDVEIRPYNDGQHSWFTKGTTVTSMGLGSGVLVEGDVWFVNILHCTGSIARSRRTGNSIWITGGRSPYLDPGLRCEGPVVIDPSVQGYEPRSGLLPKASRPG